jgi:hypothetical protein
MPKRQKTVTNFLNPQMTQIDADGEKDNPTVQELVRPCLARRSTVVEALVPRAYERQAVGTTASTTAPGSRLDYRRLVFNLRPPGSSADCSKRHGFWFFSARSADFGPAAAGSADRLSLHGGYLRMDSTQISQSDSLQGP